MSKEVFCEIIENLQTVDDYHKGLNGYFEKSGVQGFLYSPDATASVAQLLKAMFEDDDNIIGTFCFDMDYGRSYKSGYLKDQRYYYDEITSREFALNNIQYEFLNCVNKYQNRRRTLLGRIQNVYFELKNFRKIYTQ